MNIKSNLAPVQNQLFSQLNKDLKIVQKNQKYSPSTPQESDNVSLSSKAQDLINNETIGAAKSSNIGVARPGTVPPPPEEMRRIDGLLKEAAKKYDIPLDNLRAVAWQESKWNEDAKSIDAGHGKGIMQIDDRWHKFARTEAVWDAEKNINYGAKFLKDLNKEAGGSWWATYKKYNGGNEYPGLIFGHMKNKPWNQYY